MDTDYRDVARKVLVDLAENAEAEDVRLDAARELAMIAAQDEMRAEFSAQSIGDEVLEPASREAAQQRRS